MQKQLNELCLTKSLPFSNRETSWTATSLASEVGIQPRLPCSRLLKPKDWQEQHPNLQYLSCWIIPQLLTRLSNKSSSQLAKGISGTALQWFESYLSDRSFKVFWRGEVSKSLQGSFRAQFLDHFLVFIASLGSVIHKHGFSYNCYADDLSFHPDDPIIAACISACLKYISCWMKDHHLQLNLAKTELVSANPSFHHNFIIQLSASTITTSKTAKKFGVMIDYQLNFSDHSAKTTRSCRFALFNIRKIRSFLSEHASQLLIQALVLSRLDFQQVPSNIYKIIQNAAARLAFNELKRLHATPLFINLHWLPIAAYKTTTVSAPLCLNTLLQAYVPSRSVISASERHIIVPFQKAQNPFTDFYINCSGRLLVPRLAQEGFLIPCFFPRKGSLYRVKLSEGS